jgi:hypothetical protein
MGRRRRQTRHAVRGGCSRSRPRPAIRTMRQWHPPHTQRNNLSQLAWSGSGAPPKRATPMAFRRRPRSLQQTTTTRSASRSGLLRLLRGGHAARPMLFVRDDEGRQRRPPRCKSMPHGVSGYRPTHSPAGRTSMPPNRAGRAALRGLVESGGGTGGSGHDKQVDQQSPACTGHSEVGASEASAPAERVGRKEGHRVA